jgi:aspartoacylase
MVMTSSLERVAVAGGTHGNELTGVHLIRHWLSNPGEVQRDGFATELHLVNPEAIEQVRRYVDQDLNRQFRIDDLENPDLQGVEQRRAKALNAQLGPKQNPQVDFVIDMHTTTANMGVSLLINSGDPLVIETAFYVKQRMPRATLFHDPRDRLADSSFRSMGRLGGLGIEVGPVPQGLLHYRTCAETREAVAHALDYLARKNAGTADPVPERMEGYRFLEKVPFPVDARGEIAAMIHPDLQDGDYREIRPGDPLFLSLSGEQVAYEGDRPVFGAFINEAAYYDKQIGLSLMEKVTIRPE